MNGDSGAPGLTAPALVEKERGPGPGAVTILPQPTVGRTAQGQGQTGIAAILLVRTFHTF